MPMNEELNVAVEVYVPAKAANTLRKVCGSESGFVSFGL